MRMITHFILGGIVAGIVSAGLSNLHEVPGSSPTSPAIPDVQGAGVEEDDAMDSMTRYGERAIEGLYTRPTSAKAAQLMKLASTLRAWEIRKDVAKLEGTLDEFKAAIDFAETSINHGANELGIDTSRFDGDFAELRSIHEEALLIIASANAKANEIERTGQSDDIDIWHARMKSWGQAVIERMQIATERFQMRADLFSAVVNSHVNNQ